MTDQWTGLSPYLDKQAIPQPQVPQMSNPLKPSREQAMSEVYKEAAQMAIMGGNSELGNGLLKMADHIYKGGTQRPFDANNEYDAFLALAQPQHGQDITTQEGYNQAVKWWGTPTGQELWKKHKETSNEYKYTQAGEYVGEDGRWWRTHPKTGRREFLSQDANGNWDWTYDPKVKPSQPVQKEIKTIPAEVENGISMMQGLKANLSNIQSQLKSANDVFGPLSGRYNELKNTLFGDAVVAEMLAQLGLNITLVYGLSGKQVADKEMERFNRTILPQIKDPNIAVEKKLKVLDEYITNIYNNRLHNLKSFRYNTGDLQPWQKLDFSFGEQQQPLKGPSTKYGGMSDEDLLKELSR